MAPSDRPEDLEQLADDLMWAGDSIGCEDALRRAYASYLNAGNDRRAGYVAVMLMDLNASKGNQAAATVCYQDALRLLGAAPDCVERAWFLVYQGIAAHRVLQNNDLALQLLTSARDIAVRVGDRVAEMGATAYRGRVMAMAGDAHAGMAALDEAMASAVRGELDRTTAAFCFCMMLNACKAVSDYRRAAQWIEQVRQRESEGRVLAYPGECRLHHAAMLRLKGDWSSARKEAELAAGEMADWPWHEFLGEAEYELGMLKLLAGDLDGAAEAFRLAHGRGRDPQPGLALLSLASSDPQAAARSIAAALSTVGATSRDPSELLVAAADIGRAARVPALVDQACAGLETLLGRLDTGPVRARAAYAQAVRHILRAEYEHALGTLTAALDAWRALEAPYEIARTRCLLAEAFSGAGDPGRAALELDAAREAFARLGATVDFSRSASALEPESTPSSLTPREYEVLRLLAAGRTNREIAADLVVSIATIERHVANVYRKIGVRSRVEATAYALARNRPST